MDYIDHQRHEMFGLNVIHLLIDYPNELVTSEICTTIGKIMTYHILEWGA
jgi:hypothetical protein